MVHRPNTDVCYRSMVKREGTKVRAIKNKISKAGLKKSNKMEHKSQVLQKLRYTTYIKKYSFYFYLCMKSSDF